MVRQTVLGFKLERTEEELTAHGGLALMAEYNHGLGLAGLVDRYLPRPGSNRGYAPSVFVDSLVLMLEGGGSRLEDLRELERESGLMRLVGVDRIPDPDTVGDWLRRMGAPETGGTGLWGLGQVRDALNRRILRRDGISEYTLDADAMQIEGEKREAQYTYQKVKGYMPMLGFLFETPVCLYEEFREGNVAPQTGQESFYRECRARVPEGKRIAFYRADAASYQAELINTLEDDGVIWAVTADQTCAVKALLAGFSETDWKEPMAGCGYEVAETVHVMAKTPKAFRLIAKRTLRRQADLFEEGDRYIHHVVATNWPEERKNAQAVLEWHNQRGQAENFNRELKSGFGLDRLPCGQLGANAVFFRVGIIAYNLFIGFKRLACPQAWWHHTIATFRWKMIQIAGRIVSHAGQVFLKLSVAAEALALFHDIRGRCFELVAET